MGRRRLHPKHKLRRKWYQKENEWGDFVFDWSLGLKPDTWRAIFAITIFIFACIMMLGFLGKAGAVGLSLSDLTKKLFGSVGALVFNIIFAYAGIILLVPPRKGYRLAEFIGLFLLALSVPTFFHLFIVSELARETAQFGRGGGLIGLVISSPLRSGIGLFPTFLLVVSLSVISIMMIFDLSPLSLLGIRTGEEKEEKEKGKVNVRGENKISVFEAVKRKFGGLRRSRMEAKARVIEIAHADPPVSLVRKDITWKYPSLEILKEVDEVANPGNIYKNAEAIQKCLKTFSIDVALGDANVGPTVTQYTLKPSEGVKLNGIIARQNDLALALSAKSIRIEAPIPGKNAVGVEIPNKVPAKVTLKEILVSPEFKAVRSKLALALGRDVAGEAMAIDLEKMPHMLIAGATGSGKSVCINTLIVSLLFNNSPSDLKLILVDPKRVEMTCYNDIPHLITPVVIEIDKTVSALKWAVWEMERRYKLFSELGKRNIIAYNESPGPEGKLPYIVIIVDELADLMATSAKEVEGSIVRLAQMARATGMHLVIATQRPSVDVLTGLIKANITSRIAFATASQVDSRTILDMSGAEKLLGNGDMLFIGNGVSKPRRIQGCYVSDKEIEEVANFLRTEDRPRYDEAILSFGGGNRSSAGSHGAGNGSGEDDLYDEALETVVNAGKASASLLQRRLKVGYARAARLLDILEQNGAIGPADGAKPRDVLVDHGGGFQSNNFRGGDNFDYTASENDESSF